MAMQGCVGKDGVVRRKRRGAGTAQGVNWVFLEKNGWSRVPMQSEIRTDKSKTLDKFRVCGVVPSCLVPGLGNDLGHGECWLVREFCGWGVSSGLVSFYMKRVSLQRSCLLCLGIS